MQYSEALISGQNLPMSEALSTGGITTLVGLAIVFGVLVILMIVLCLFKVFFYKEPAKKAAPVAAPVEPAAPAPAAEAEEDVEDEEELIAVLTAAVAASLNTSTYNLQIKSYRRVPNKRPAWNNAGLRETIGNRI